MNSQPSATKKSNEFKRPIVLGVAGGTGLGKTTVVREILKALDSDDVLFIQLDSYYIDRSHL